MGKHESGYPRVNRDFYPTPAWTIDALAEHVHLKGKHVWEPACGYGRMAEALKDFGAAGYATDIVDRGYLDLDAVDDFLALQQPKCQFDSIITNPPGGERNTLAVKFAEHGLKLLPKGGFMALLLPADFDTAKTRRHLFADCEQFYGKIILLKRIKWFDIPGKAEGPKENHAWFLWWNEPFTIFSEPSIYYAPRILNDRGAQ